jgi:hypothetical protein
MEIALVSRTRVALGRVASGKFVVSKAAPWATLAPMSPVPMREPLAGAALARQGELLVATTDRAGVRLDASLSAVGRFAGIPVPFGNGAACASTTLDVSSFEGELRPCSLAREAPVLAPSLPRYDAFAQAEITGRDGNASAAWAEREPSAKMQLHLGSRTLTIDGVGGQVVVGDLDLDGVPEVVTTSDGGDDAIAISSWTADGLRARAKLPAPAGVRALAICPPEERGLPALVAAVSGEIWIWR